MFAPRREHARFCSARCRVAWNRENASDPAAGASALDWSITAMRDATGRLAAVTGRDRPRAFAAISEAVWWVTIVDATLVRHHPDTYDAVLAGQAQPERGQIEGTLSGLRFVRNRMGQYLDPVDFIQPAEGRSGSAKGDGEAAGGCVMGWVWKTVPEPEVASLPLFGMLSEGLHLVGACAFSDETYRESVGFLASGEVPVERLVSERVSLDDTPDALRRLQTPGTLVRIISRPWQ